SLEMTNRHNCHGSVQLPLGSNLNCPCARNDSRSRGRWGDAASPISSPNLLGTCCLDRKSVFVSCCCLVDLLSLAKSTTLDILPLRFCSHLANHPLPGSGCSLSTRGRRR